MYTLQKGRIRKTEMKTQHSNANGNKSYKHQRFDTLGGHGDPRAALTPRGLRYHPRAAPDREPQKKVKPQTYSAETVVLFNT